jgi:branched-chain amino acid transport system substrate-binding protein
LGAKKVAILYPNDALGKTILDLYGKLFKEQGIESVAETFEPGTKDFSAPLAKLASYKPDFLMPGYSDAVLYDIVRQATESGLATKLFIVRGSIGPALKNKDMIDDYIAYVPKYFEGAEKTDPAVKKFVEDYKRFYKTEFPYDQAPLCASSCYDHVYMLVQAMKTAGTVSDVAKIRAALVAQTYRGLWNYKFDDTGEAVFSFNIVHVKKGGDIALTTVDPTATTAK